jgi:hypothetical protein
MSHPSRVAQASALVLLLLAAPRGAAAEAFFVDVLSNPLDGVNDFGARIAGGVVVWQHGTGAASEIRMFESGGPTVNVTQNGVADELPDTDGASVVWQQAFGAQTEIAVFDLVTRMTSFPLINAVDDTEPRVSGSYIAWLRQTGADNEVFLNPNVPSDQITGNTVEESQLVLEGDKLVWTQVDDNGTPANPGDDDTEIWVWNPSVPGLYQLSNNSVQDQRPAMSGSRIVWQSGADGDADVWYGDTSGGAARLIDGTDDRNPDIDDDVVVWQRSEGTDFEIFKRDLASPTLVQVSTNAFDDVTPRISGNHIVWVVEPAVGDSEIWVSWQGAAAEPVPSTQADGRDDVNPEIDGDRFVWESCLNLGEPNEQCEIVLAPEAHGAATALSVLAALAYRRGRSSALR